VKRTQVDSDKNRRRLYLAAWVAALALTTLQCENPLVEKIAREASRNLTLTVTSQGSGITDPAGSVEVERGVEIAIGATAAAGYQFSEWSVVSGTGVSFGHTSLSSTTVKLEEENATIRALFVGARDINIRNQDGNKDIPAGGELEFGDAVIVGSPKEILCRIENLGQSVLTLAGPPVIGPLGNQYDYNAFSFNILPSLAIVPGSYSNFSIVFDPAEYKEYTALLVIYSDDADEGTYTVALTGTGVDTPVADMHVRVGSEDIPSTTPAYEYAFGDTLLNSDNPVTFILENLGSATLDLSASPSLVNLGGADAGLFSVTSLPDASVAKDSSTSFTIEFSPAAAAGPGTKSASVSISNNDPDENPYEFTITAQAVTPEINVQQGGIDLSIGQTYDYRYRVMNETHNVSFTIQNTGTAVLELTAPVQKVGSTRFSIVAQPTTSIAAGSSAGFTVGFTPTDFAEQSATISISSTDLDESTYTFDIIGEGALRVQPAIDTISANTVSMSADTLVIGSSHEDRTAASQGAVYIHSRDQGGADAWGQIKELTAYDGLYNDQFGISTAVSGDYLIVGADGDDVGDQNQAGSAYMYYRNEGGTDNWGLKQHIFAPTPTANHIFGWSVALGGSTAAVGAPLGNRVYLFYRDQGGTHNWGLKKELAGSSGTQFGSSLALEGDLLAVTATYSTTVRLYSRNQGGTDNWGLLKTLSASDGGAGFGSAAALSGDYLIIGAGGAGAAYVFGRDQGGAGNWGEITKLEPSNGAGDGFGASAAIVDLGTTAAAIVGADDTDYAYLFEFDGSTWSETGIVDLGCGVALNADFAALCAINWPNEAAYVIQH